MNIRILSTEQITAYDTYLRIEERPLAPGRSICGMCRLCLLAEWSRRDQRGCD